MNISAGPPDAYMNSFQGTLHYLNKNFPITAKNFIMRNAYLKNTDWVMGNFIFLLKAKLILGVVVYTGYDTKIMRN